MCSVKIRSYFRDALIAGCGPLVNAAFFAFFYVLYKIHPLNGFYSYASAANLALVILNLMPVAPLDGYAVMTCIFMSVCDYDTGEKICRSVSRFFLNLLFVSGIAIFVLSKYNFSLLAVWVCLLLENSRAQKAIVDL